MITIGQTWISPSGVAYIVEREIKGGYEVAVYKNGPVTASDGRWHFTPAKFQGLVESEGLKLYDASAALDQIAEKLESKKLHVLAAAIDAISAEYVGGMLPLKLRGVQRRRLEDQSDSLIRQLKEAEDPENIARITEQLVNELQDAEPDQISDVLDFKDPQKGTPISDTKKISSPTKVTR